MQQETQSYIPEQAPQIESGTESEFYNIESFEADFKLEPPVEDYQYSSEGLISYGLLYKYEDGRVDLFVDGSPLSAIVTGETLNDVNAALNQCERMGHSIWIAHSPEGTIYTEFKLADQETGQTIIRIYTNPDAHTASLLNKQNEYFVSSGIAFTQPESSFNSFESDFSKSNHQSALETGISISVQEQHNKINGMENFSSPSLAFHTQNEVLTKFENTKATKQPNVEAAYTLLRNWTAQSNPPTSDAISSETPEASLLEQGETQPSRHNKYLIN